MSEENNEQEKSPKRFHKTRKVCGISAAVCFEFLLMSLMLVLIAGGGIIYTISKGNLDLDFVRQQLEKNINDEIKPFHIETGTFDIEWKNIFKRPVFHVKGLSFLNEHNQKIITLEGLSFTLSRSKLIFGGFVPRIVKLKGLDLHFMHMQDGSVQLGFNSGPNIKIYQPGKQDLSGDFSSLDKLYNHYLKQFLEDGFLSGLQDLEISNSSLVFENIEKDYVLFFPRIDIALQPSDNKLLLSVSTTIQNESQKDNLDMLINYDSKYKALSAEIATKDFNPFLLASLFENKQINLQTSSIRVDSHIQANFDNYLNLQSAEIKSSSSSGRIDLPSLYDHPFEFDRLNLNGFFNRQNLTLDLKDSNIKAYDMDVDIEGSIPVFMRDIQSYQVPLKFYVSNMNMPLEEKSFPDAFQEKPIYKWLTQKIQKGTIKNLNMDMVLGLNRQEDGAWKGKFEKLLGNFNFENLTVDYKNPLPPLIDISGNGRIDSGPDTMDFEASSGQLGKIPVKNIKANFIDVLAKKKSTMTLDFDTEKAKLSDIFIFLSNEPINIQKNITFSPESVEGVADLHVKIQAQTKEKLPLEEMMIEVNGGIKNFLIPKLVKDLDVSAEDMTFQIKDSLMQAKGKGRISGRETDFEWQHYMRSADKPFKMKVDANLVTDVNLRRYFGLNIDDFVSGPVGAKITYTSHPDKSAEIDMRADLRSAQLQSDILGYLKPSGEAGTATLRANLKEGVLQSVEGLNVSAPNLDITNASLTFQEGQLKSGSFNNAKIGSSLTSLIFNFETRELINLNISGKSFDARMLLAENKKRKNYKGPSIKATMKVDEILTRGEQRIKNGKVFMSMLQNGDINQFEMDGVCGAGKVYIRYTPGPKGSPNLHAEFGDGGASLRAFGLYKNVRGGTLTVTGTSSDPSWLGNISGNFLLQNFSVKNAPVLAKLMNAMSLPGLGQLLGNDGIVFSKLTADFKWTARPEGALISVQGGRTSGSELGLTFEGDIDRSTNTLNLEGTIVPVSTLNTLIGDIPLLGPVITGGTGALIAATYKVKGPYDNAEVRINPLSALAPGIIRRILFED